MLSKIVLRHVAGIKKGQIETLAFVDDEEITLGREVGSKVQFDPEREITVSRKHALIKASNNGTTFTLSDRGSTHGTFLNGKRILHPVEIAPERDAGAGKIFKANYSQSVRENE